MSLVRKYDKTLRRKYSYRAVWIPGTEIKIGDILLLKDGALVSMGNIQDENITYGEEAIADIDSIDIQSRGVSQTIVQNGARVALDKLETAIDAELNISFNSENSYYLKTPKLSGIGMKSAMTVARKIAGISTWNFLKNYVVHQVYLAEDFVFLGSIERGHSISFKGKGEAIINIIINGISADLSTVGENALSLKVTGKAGPVVMRLIRVKRNGDIY